MIDTLKLSLYDTQIKNNANLTIIPGDIDYSTGEVLEHNLFTNQQGKVIRGKKAVLNNELFNLTILPSYELKDKKVKKDLLVLGENWLHTRGEIDIKTNNSPRIFVQTSLPKISNHLKQKKEYNLKPITQDDIPGIVTCLSNSIFKNGISTDIEAANISRLDLFNNVQTISDYENYQTVFQELNMQRKRSLNYGGETFLYYNKSSELCIYDKTKELLRKDIIIPEKIIRFENRFLNKKSYFNKFNNCSINSLLEFNEYRKELINIGNEIFERKQIELFDYNEETIINILKDLKQTNRFWFRDFFYKEGLSVVLEKISMKNLLNIFEGLMVRSQFYKLKKDILNFKFSKSVFNHIKTKNLFVELKEKYFNNLAA